MLHHVSSLVVPAATRQTLPIYTKPLSFAKSYLRHHRYGSQPYQRFYSSIPTSSLGPTYETNHPPRLHNLTTLVTGSSSGLGRAIALSFASHGSGLVFCADLSPNPRPEGLEPEDALPTHEPINRLYGAGRASFARADVNCAKEVEAAVEMAVGGSGNERIDVLVNNAGLGNVSGSPLLHDLKEEDWDRVLNVNLRGTYITNKFALRQMITQQPIAWPSSFPHGILSKRQQRTRRGVIINLASMLSTIALPNGTAAYCASKGGVLNLTKQLALDYAKHAITVNALCPGFTKTAMTSGNWGNPKTSREMESTTPLGWGNVEDVARMAVSLASEDAVWMTGEGVVVDGGYSAQ